MAQSQFIRTDLPFSILLVRLHPDTEQEHHAYQRFSSVASARLPSKKGCGGGEEDKVYPHLLEVAPEP